MTQPTVTLPVDPHAIVRFDGVKDLYLATAGFNERVTIYVVAVSDAQTRVTCIAVDNTVDKVVLKGEP